MKYLAEGRIIPERVDLTIPLLLVGFAFEEGRCEFKIEIIKARIYVHVTAPSTLSIPELRNILISIVGDVVNLVGFEFVWGITFEIDSITELERPATQVFGVEGYAFDTATSLSSKIKFRKRDLGVAELDIRLLGNRAVSRANFELRNSIRYPDYTALHCRFAIEAVRNHFNAANEPLGWQLLRRNLLVGRETLDLFKPAADEQRHGRNVPQSWEDRQMAMQISWEVCHRFFE